MTRKATDVERPRCVHCRNPIKDHQAAVGPTEGDRTFHEDCWTAAHPDAVPCAPSVASAAPAADRPVAAAEELVEQRQPEASEAEAEAEPSSDEPVAEASSDEPVAEAEAEPSSEQRDYERSIASGGLAALLSPYVKGLPAQRNSAESVPA